MYLEIAFHVVDMQAFVADCLQGCAALHDRNIFATVSEHTSEITSYGSSSNHCDAHVFLLSFWGSYSAVTANKPSRSRGSEPISGYISIRSTKYDRQASLDDESSGSPSPTVDRFGLRPAVFDHNVSDLRHSQILAGPVGMRSPRADNRQVMRY